MSKWPMVTAGDVLLRIEAGKSVKTRERPAHGDELGILKVSAVTWGTFRPGENKAILTGYQPGDCPRPTRGDILLSRANTRELVGAPVLVGEDHPNLLLSDKILRLVPNETRVDRRYMVRALRSTEARRHFEKCAGGTSGSMTNITHEDIRSTPLPLPPLPEQRRIADILDKADAIRRKRKQAIALTEELLRSTFLEMFGDPVTNPKGWPVEPLRDLIRDTRLGLVRAASEQGPDREYAYIRMNSIRNNGYLDLRGTTRIDATKEERFSLRLEDGDFLFNTRNSQELVGKAAVFHERGDYLFNNNIMRIRFTDRVDPDYIAAYWQTAQAQQELDKRKSGTTSVFAIYFRSLATLPIPTPPPEEQRRYGQLCKSAQSYILTQQLAADAADLLLRSLLRSCLQQ